jgi:AAHS family 4-hydroxybenzoate transporter-like MFS transporter
MPTFFQELGGIPIQEFAISAMIAFAGGAAGTLTIGWLMDRVNPYWLIAGFFMIDAFALTALGRLPFGTPAFLIAMIAWNYTQIGGQTGINTLATLGYPPEMRSSGIGWAGGWGRIAGIVLPAYAGAKALELMLPLDTIMMLVAVPAVVVAVLILLLGFVKSGNWEQGAPRVPAPAH